MNKSLAYHILGLAPGTSEKDIKAAYRRLVKKLHPDVNPAPGAQEQFVQLKRAFDYLLTEQEPDRQHFHNEEAIRQAQWRNEQRARWRKQQEENALQRLRTLQQVYRVLNYLVACCFLSGSILALDYALPPTVHQEEVVEVREVYEGTGTRGAGGRRRYTYDDVYFKNFKLRVLKGEGPASRARVMVYTSPLLQIVRRAEIAEKVAPTILRPAYGFYATFGLLIPLVLLLGIIYYQLPLHGETRLGVGLIILFIGFFHLVLALLE
jgi:hypothetical protein